MEIFLGQLSTIAAGDGKAPDSFVILKDGPNASRKGTLLLDDKARASIMEDFALGGIDLGIDLDHAFADPKLPPEHRRAYGWFKLSVNEDRSLGATQVEWTPGGRQLVESKEWRYTSLWGDVEPTEDKKALRLMRVRSVSLVNRPAALGNQALVAHEDSPAQRSEERTMELSAIAIALSAKTEDEALTTAKTLQTTMSAVTTTLSCKSIAEVPGALAAIKLKADKHDELVAAEAARLLAEKTASEKAAGQQKTALIKQLSENGQLTPTLHAWAEGQSLESLTAFAAGAPKQTPANVASNSTTGVAVTLSEDEMLVADRLGVSHEQALKAKQAEEARKQK